MEWWEPNGKMSPFRRDSDKIAGCTPKISVTILGRVATCSRLQGTTEEKHAEATRDMPLFMSSPKLSPSFWGGAEPFFNIRVNDVDKK